jgi:hypothetical protein
VPRHTVIYGRAPDYTRTLVSSLAAGDPDAAKTLGIAPDMLGPALLDPQTQAMVAPLVHKVALTTLAALVVVPMASRTLKPEEALPGQS